MLTLMKGMYGTLLLLVMMFATEGSHRFRRPCFYFGRRQPSRHVLDMYLSCVHSSNAVPCAHEGARYARQPVADERGHAPGELKAWLLDKARYELIHGPRNGKRASCKDIQEASTRVREDTL